MRSLRLFAAIALLTFASAPLTRGQATQAPLDSDLARAYGFINGQRFQLSRIKNEYPDLGVLAQKAELEFQAAFGQAERQIEKVLQEMAADGYADFVAQMKERIRITLSSQPMSREIAVSFITEVEQRAKGQISSPVLETLLTYQFKERPAEELVRGYSRVFRTKDHPKAKGVDFQIRYPTSWRSAEGERPNVIQKFVSENGRGSEMILLMVKDIPIPAGYKVTRKELDEFFNYKDLTEMVPTNATVLSVKPIVLEGQKGGMLIYDQTLQRLDITLKSRSLSFVTILSNKMVFLQCVVSTPLVNETEMLQRFSRLEPLFKWVGNSFVVPGRYESNAGLSHDSAVVERNSTLTQNQKIKITISGSSISVKGREIVFPIDTTELFRLLGPPDRTSELSNTIFTWDNIGIIAYERPNTNKVIQLGIAMGTKRYAFWPAKTFSGVLTIDNARISRQSKLIELNRVKSGRKFVQSSLPFIWEIRYLDRRISINKGTADTYDNSGEVLEVVVEILKK